MKVETLLIPITWLGNMHHGYGCGYIGLPKEHPWFNLGYDEIEQKYNVSIHGGLTYSGINPQTRIKDELWWIGFDTAHYSDTQKTCDKIFCEQEIESLKNQALNCESLLT